MAKKFLCKTHTCKVFPHSFWEPLMMVTAGRNMQDILRIFILNSTHLTELLLTYLFILKK
jgi:hypothetical protein